MNWSDLSKAKVSALSKEKARMIFSIRNNNVEWRNIIFIGLKEMYGVTMLFTISQRVSAHCTFRVVIGRLRRLEYIAFLDAVVLPIWNYDQSFIFMQVSKIN